MTASRHPVPLLLGLALAVAGAGGAAPPPYPILFVTQPPIPRDFATVNATFANHTADVGSAGRGGDLWIRYPDGTLRNLTAAAGFGNAGFQGAGAIAVRDPDVHWDGAKAVFAMAVGSVERQYQLALWRWQLYEVTGLMAQDTPVITRVPNQPALYNNIMPVYGADDRIVFVSDRPRDGQAHLYPQRDEYELTASNSGLWSLDPSTGDLRLLDHSPSGDFHPLVDSSGRVIFTRWDHLQRDQLADADAGPVSNCYGGTFYGTFNYADESAAAAYDLADRTEVFPEPRACRNDLLAGTGLAGHTFNQFLPWMILPDGTEAETLNHIGRHELRDYVERSRIDDPDVVDFNGPGPRANQSPINNFFQAAESPLVPGLLLGVDAPEFGTHAAGQVVRITGDPALRPHEMVVTYLTHRDTAGSTDTPGPDHSGLYRDPIELSDGTVVAAHTGVTREDRNEGSRAAPVSRYDFRLKTLSVGGNGYLAAAAPLTPGIVKAVSWWDPDTLVSHDGPLWELSPVEVRPRPRPPVPVAALPGPEAQVFAEEGVDPAAFRLYLERNGLALIVSRDVTTRDQADRQQPYNLRVPGGVETTATTGRVYDVGHLQIFQGDQLRGTTGCCGTTPLPGRRVLARALHDPAALACDPTPAGAPAGSKAVATDGSVAALVPARRALTWQLTDPAGTGVVRERYWLTFQPGEMRVCASCHGLNVGDQIGRPVPQNRPEALRRLLAGFKTCAALPARLLRNKDVTLLFPLTPARDQVLPLAASRDTYQPAFASGDLDPETGVVGETGRPLVFYQTEGSGALRLVKKPGTRLAIYF